MGSLVRVARKIALIAAFMLGAGHSLAEAASITLAWDRNPEPTVVSYRVYVGTESGTYPQTFDVDRALFTFNGAVPGRRYYFTVAAVTVTGVVGFRSAEISGVADGTPPVGTDVSVESTSRICLGAGTDCYTPQFAARSLGAISALTTLPDGRLIFIENGRQLRIVSGTTLFALPALRTAVASRSFGGIAVDPSFIQSRFIFVSEIDAFEGGQRTLTIVRYREVQNALGEAAPIITGLPLPAVGDPEFTIAADGRFYVSIPASPGFARGAESPYSGYILRFEFDGSVPKDSRGASPIFAVGYVQPTAVASDPLQQRLWLTGVEAGPIEPFNILGLTASETEIWPRFPTPVRLSAAQRATGPATPEALAVRQAEQGSTDVFVVSANGLQRVKIGRDQKAKDVRDIRLVDYGQPVTIAPGIGPEVYVGVRVSGATGSSPFAILKLQPSSP
jgi:hypothetical protein